MILHEKTSTTENQTTEFCVPESDMKDEPP